MDGGIPERGVVRYTRPAPQRTDTAGKCNRETHLSALERVQAQSSRDSPGPGTAPRLEEPGIRRLVPVLPGGCSPLGRPERDGKHQVSHFLSSSTFYELQAAYSHDNTRRGFCDDNGDGVVSIGEDGSYLTWSDASEVARYFGGVHSSNPALFFSTPDDGSADWTTAAGPSYKLNHPLFLYEDYTHRTLNVRGTLRSQFLPQHQISIGGEFCQHWIEKLHRDTQWAGYSGVVFFEEMWSRRPLELSGFFEYRLESRGLIATMGLRVDAFDFDAADITDYFAPRQMVTNASGLVTLVPVRGEKVPLAAYISPRLGVSHPITDRAALYFSLARTVSPLPYSCLYYNYDSWRGSEAMSRIDQQPLIATTYDIGSQWSPLDGLIGSLALFYRDMENYSFTAIQPVVTSLSYVVVRRTGSANTRGAELSLGYRPEQIAVLSGLRARLAYTYSAFKLSRTLYHNQWQYTAQQCSTFGTPGQLPFDDMQHWESTYGRDYSGQSTMLSGFDRTHRLTLSISMPLPLGLRIGCIGIFASGFFYPEVFEQISGPGAYYEAGYREGPWDRRFDLRLEKSIDLPGLGRIKVFADLINVFNWTNVLTYYAYNDVTFKAWAQKSDPTGGPAVNQPVTQEGSLVYGVPREFFFGMNVTF